MFEEPVEGALATGRSHHFVLGRVDLDPLYDVKASRAGERMREIELPPQSPATLLADPIATFPLPTPFMSAPPASEKARGRRRWLRATRVLDK